MKTFYDPVTLRASHKGWGINQPQELELLLKIIRVILASVIRSKKQSEIFADMLFQRTVGLLNCCSERFHGIKSIPTLTGMPGNNFVIKVVYNPKKPAPAFLQGIESLPVGSPHTIRQLCLDRSCMIILFPFRLRAGDRKKVVLSHNPVNPLLRSLYSTSLKALPGLLVPFVQKWTFKDLLSDFNQQLIIPNSRTWPWANLLAYRLIFSIIRRRRKTCYRQDHTHGISPFHGIAYLILHFFNEFPRPEIGKFSFFFSNSFSICNRPKVLSYSAIWLSLVCFLKPASPFLMKASRHADKSATVTWFSRLTSSMSLPLNNSKTSWALSFALFRFTIM